MFKFLKSGKLELKDLSQFTDQESYGYSQYKPAVKTFVAPNGNTELSWADSQIGETAVVLMPGTTGCSEPWFPYFQKLRENHRVLALDLPPVTDVDHFCKLMSEWMDELGLKKAVIVGQSFGGALAQAFCDTYPGKVGALVLITSFSCTEDVSDKTRKGYDRSLARFIHAAENLKFESLQKSLHKQVLKGIDVADVENKPFWKAFYGNMLMRSSRELLKAVHELQRDYWKRLSPNLSSVDYPVLLIEAKTDALYDREEKKALIKRFPCALKVEIDGSANMSHIRAFSRITQAIERFIEAP